MCFICLQTNDLKLVHRGVKFACFYSLDNLEARWAGLLYDPAISKVSKSAIQKLHPKVVESVYKSALFSKEEHALLKTFKSVSVEVESNSLKIKTSKFVLSYGLNSLYSYILDE